MAAAGGNKQQQTETEGCGCSSSSTSSSSSSSRPAWVVAASQQKHEPALRGRYELVSVRGKGSFAKVWEARHRRTGHRVAVKIISHAKMVGQGMSARKTAREIQVMRLLRHPHVVRFYETTATRTHTYIVMELADGGQLHDHVVLQGRLDEGEARALFRQLADAVLYCHRSMVAHRDLKMENVLLSSSGGGGAGGNSNSIKVVDFGFSKLYTDAKQPMHKKRGSPAYAAPELLLGGGGGFYEGPQVDVWSCGVILYGMLCGGLPFDGADVSELARNVRRGHYRRVPSWVSDHARDLIAGMLIVRPDKRMTMAEVVDHPWLLRQQAMPLLPMPPAAGIHEAAVEQLVTRYGFQRRSLLESLRQQHLEEQDDDEAAVAYQLVLASMSMSDDADTMRPPPPPAPAAAAEQQVILHDDRRDCPCLTTIADALEELRIPIVSYHYHQGRRRHRIKCRLDVPAPAARHDGLQMNNDILDSLSAAVFFEIQVYKTAGESPPNLDANPHPQYAVDLNRTSGPLLPFLSICSQLSSRLRRHNNNNNNNN